MNPTPCDFCPEPSSPDNPLFLGHSGKICSRCIGEAHLWVMGQVRLEDLSEKAEEEAA